MTSFLHPLRATEQVHQSYLRYLVTTYPLRDPDLRAQLWQELKGKDRLVKGPLIESSEPFVTGRTIRQLVQDGVLHNDFPSLCSEALPLDRPLYLHQDQAIQKVARLGRNIVMATGTGSGKTEGFLIPILDHLLGQREAGKLAMPGVRALLLYPMNALANDQLKRLRRLLQHFPWITFGRYIGETEDTKLQAEVRFVHQFPHEPRLSNELISRQEMRESPPHILLTNYAMLEYLLLRPRDCEFFDGETGRWWRFLVVDEAHVYDGAMGTEIAMLLRRLKDRVAQSKRAHLRYLATSATLGKGRDDYPAVARFAAELFDEQFEWNNDDPNCQDIVEAKRVPAEAIITPWGSADPCLYGALQRHLVASESFKAESAVNLGSLSEIACKYGVPENLASTATREASQTPPEDRVGRFLYGILRGDAHLHRLRDSLTTAPGFLAAVSNHVFPDRSDAAEILVSLVELAVRAKPLRDSVPLLPARYHVFARALEGAFICLNVSGHNTPNGPRRRIFLSRHQKCPECACRVFEIATCGRCGMLYLVGRIAEDERAARGERGARPRNFLVHTVGDLESGTGTAYFVLSSEILSLDEDEAVALGENSHAAEELAGEPHTVCLRCGAVAPGTASEFACDCAERIAQPISRLKVKKGSELTWCVGCGSRSPGGKVSRLLTGQDAPVSVLATALYQALPASKDEMGAHKPGGERRLLAFSDSRQDAAFFAPYLERTYEQLLRRRLLLKTLCDDAVGRTGWLRLQDIAPRLLSQSERAGIFTQRQSYVERNSYVNTWLMQELVSLYRRISLEGVGLVNFRLVRPERWSAPQPLLGPPFGLEPDEAWNLIAVLLDTLRQQGAVTFPDDVDPRSDAFAPRNREFYVRNAQADARQGIFGWLPSGMRRNRRLDFLERLLGRMGVVTPEQCRTIGGNVLSGIWEHLSDPGGVWRDHLRAENRPGHGVLYRLSHEFWEIVPVQEAQMDLFRCSRCRAITALNMRDVCSTYGCTGVLEPLDCRDPALIENHYHWLYRNLLPIPLSAEEHTAQLTSSEAASIQESFVQGEVNVLSCSTTFELGVDVGELQAVLMRNVPPTTANYVQRAGRAGRRTDAAAFALTFAQRRSHDLTHYAHPERIVAGRVKPPVITMSNEKIVRRHVHSVLFAAFLKWCREQTGREFRTLGDFFVTEGGGETGAHLFTAFAQRRPLEVLDALRRITPLPLQKELGIEEWGWLRSGTGVGLIDLLDVVEAEVTGDLDVFDKLVDEAAKKKEFKKAGYFERVGNTIRRREILGFLGTRNVLPKYGFPTDVVELKTDHLHVDEAKKVELQRDLRLAISEYAPGSEVVAAKRVWVCGGLYKLPGRNWPVYNYAVCPSCGKYHRSISRLEGPCSCGGDLFGWRRNFGQLVIPEFGFVVSRGEPRRTGESRPSRMHSSRVYFAEYASPDGDEPATGPELAIVEALSGSDVQVWQRYSRFGKLAVVNPGRLGRGFNVCHDCGFAEAAPEVARTFRRTRDQQPPSHVNLRTGKVCSGLLRNHHLGHEFMTDVLELHFEGKAVRESEETTWRSLLYALLEGASLALGIRRDDLDGTLYWSSLGEVPALVLFDNVPGGAGHVRRIGEELAAVCRTAGERVGSCECGADTSCYECLRNYRNQPYHDTLQRGLAHRFLVRIAGQ